MPCQSDYLEPTRRETESQLVCQHLAYVFDKLGFSTPNEIKKAANRIYGNLNNLDENTALLCSLCGSMSRKQADIIIYDGRNPKARSLADWWERHTEHDKIRLKQEEEVKKVAKLKKSALNKLTSAEKKALNL